MTDETEMGWSFAASIFIVGFSYSSTLNESYWEVPPTIEVDECGPRLISPGYVLWLVFVPAAACAVQLPGSVFLHGRSTLYRLSPCIGIADALATLGLVAKALWVGYSWKTAVAAALIVREGIGQSSTWWREHRKGDEESPLYEEEMEGDSSDPVDSPGAEIVITRSPSPEVPVECFEEDGTTQPQTTQNAGPPSIERAIGGLLVIIALVKTTILLSGSGVRNTPILIASLVAIGYFASFAMFEFLTWSLSIPTSGYPVADMPRQNLLELLRIVDTGDSQILCAGRDHEGPGVQDLALELGTISHSSQGSARTQYTTSTNSVTRATMVTFFIGISMALTSLSWLVLLYNIWQLSRVVVAATAIGVVVGVGIQLAAKAWEANRTQPDSGQHMKGLCGWLEQHVTPVNIISLAWIVNIGAYIILAIPGESPIELRTPMWLDWLG